jgi:8-oxo-dGTP diphosphatase
MSMPQNADIAAQSPLLVVAAALIDGQQRLLLQRRAQVAEHGGLWEFPGGKMEAGETPEQALARELDEELAIRVETDHLIPFGFNTALGSSGRPLILLLYTCRQWDGDPHPLPGWGAAWFAHDMICSQPMPPADIPLARQLAIHLA